MKKAASIALICLLLFNWFGYRLLISFIEDRETVRLEVSLDDNNFDESQLISVKIPMRYMPYSNTSADYERVNGQIEIGGVPYKYVKRRLFNDSLEILCIPNQTALKWQDAKNEFFRFVNDLQHGKKSLPQPAGLTKSFSIDNYIQQDIFRITPCYFSDRPEYSAYAARLNFHYLSSQDHPPQRA